MWKLRRRRKYFSTKEKYRLGIIERSFKPLQLATLKVRNLYPLWETTVCLPLTISSVVVGDAVVVPLFTVK